MLKRLVLVTLLAVCGSAARAAIVVGPPQVTGNVWSYEVSLDPGVFIHNGDFFSVYDFNGLQNINWVPDVVPTDWNVEPVGTVRLPHNLVPPDDPAVPNVTVTFTGTDDFPLPDNQGGGSLIKLGTLELTGLSSGPSTLIAFGSDTHQRGQNSIFGNFSFTSGPSVVPEPSTVGLLAAGLLVVGTLVRRRARTG